LLKNLPLPDGKPLPKQRTDTPIHNEAEKVTNDQPGTEEKIASNPEDVAKDLLLSSPTEAYIPFQSSPLPEFPRKRNSRNADVSHQADFLSSTVETQDELSAQLSDMAKHLKANALHFAGSLEKDKAVMESAESQLEKNVDKMSRTRTQLKTVSSKGRGTTWLVLASVVGVIIAFMVMVMLIRIT